MSPHPLRAHSLLLSDDDRREIARGAATLSECLARPGAAPAASDAEGGGVLDAWAQAFAPGDARAFARRLEWDGLDAASVLRALVAPAAAAAPPPDWTEWLDRFLLAAAAFADALGSAAADEEIARVVPSPEPPFLEIWVALARPARAAVDDAWGDVHPAARAGFERRLILDFSAAGEMALYDLFRRFDGEPSAGARYPAFVRGLLGGGLAAVFITYPVLARQLALLASTWVASTTELLSRLRRDQGALAAAFGGGADPGALRDAAPGLSDRHHGGRTVTALTFTSGLRVVYKPRDMGLEGAFQRFQAWLAGRGARSLPRPVRVVEGEGYGWAERVDAERFDDRGQAADYFRRAGTALAILHVLRADDAHQENVIATRGGPILVDAEMLLQPMTRAEADDARADGVIDGAAHGVPRSCLSPGFVTLLDIDASGNTYDVGGLMPASPRAAAGGEREWRALRSDDLHFVRERTVRPALVNDVVLDGVAQRAEAFADEILSGFAEAYRFFLAERGRLLDPAGPLALFAAARGRILFRPSDQYGFFLRALFAPRYQRRGTDRGVALEMLNRVFASEERRPMLWPLVADERRALEALDVPRYVLPVGARVLAADSGETVRGHLVLSGLDAVRAGLAAMSEVDLERQLDLLRSALEVVETPTGTGTPAAVTAPDPAAAWIRGAEALGARIVAGGRRGDDGTLTWIECGRAGPHGRLDLYRGQAGIGLFLAALATVTGEERFSAAAEAALRPLENVVPGWPSIGACSGVGSVVYALATTARLTGDVRWMQAALRWAEEISPARIASDPHLDVAGGTAGALLALLALDDAGRPWIRARVANCARRLLETQVATGEDCAAWPGPDGRARAGFAHGAAGIAYALTRAHAVAGEPALAEAVRRAHRHERRLFSKATQNWPAASDGGTISMTAWCHGAPGIGLARALGLEAFRDAEILEEIHVAMTTTTVAPPSRTDHLCCGAMGRCEALLVMGLRLHDREAVAAAEALATRVAERACAGGGRGIRTEGFEHRTFHPGFFRGLAGIGYQLLRAAAPSRLPSVLGFESGGAR